VDWGEKGAVSWLWPLAYQAYLDARKGGKRGTNDEHRFERCANMCLAQLVEDIEERKYEPSRGVAFIIRDPVIREVFAAPFRDRVVHHMLFNLVAEWWDRRFIYDNYSCRKGKGTLFGIQRLAHHMMAESNNSRDETYVLKLDLQGYFMSLPREGLYRSVMWGLDRQFARDSREHKLARYLWRQIIFDDPTRGVKLRGDLRGWDVLPASKSLFSARPGCGIVIGNLTSQLMSNIYLDQLDRYVVYELGFKHYGRYVDDFYMVSRDKEALIEARIKVKEFLVGLGLTLHPKKMMLQECQRGVPFLGVVVYPWRIQVGERVRRNFAAAARRYREAEEPDEKMKAGIISYRGLVKHYKHWRLVDGLLGGGGGIVVFKVFYGEFIWRGLTDLGEGNRIPARATR
jgi:hypothetical protein